MKEVMFYSDFNSIDIKGRPKILPESREMCFL